MFRLLFWKDAIKRAQEVRDRHQAEIVCMMCGEGAVPAFRNGYLVRFGFAYRHSSPEACALVMTKKRAERLAKANPFARLWAKIA